MIDFTSMSYDELLRQDGHHCDCGQVHMAPLKYLRIAQGAIKLVPEALSTLGFKKPYVVCDPNTYEAAGEQVIAILKENNIPYTLFVYPIAKGAHLEPDERTVGAAIMAFDTTCDVVMAVGSGVINDTCKLVAHTAHIPSMVVGTAPSMDGYASNSSCMIVNGVKVSLYNACPIAVICDLDIMRNAPMRMLMAGLGDVLAKCIALVDWKMAALVVDDFYCEPLANMMRYCVKKCLDNADGLVKREPEAVKAVVEGLVLSGVAMSFAGSSRPASGLEHYFSHIWEMVTLQRHGVNELHGIQVGVGTCLSLKIYQRLAKMTPDKAHALAVRSAFSQEDWEKEMRRIFGSTADTIINGEHNLWHKNESKGHAARVEKICAHWNEILESMKNELPDADATIARLHALGIPTHPSEIGFNYQDTVDAFIGAREIRNKYLSCSLMWDLGIQKEFLEDLR